MFLPAAQFKELGAALPAFAAELAVAAFSSA